MLQLITTFRWESLILKKDQSDSIWLQRESSELTDPCVTIQNYYSVGRISDN